MLPSTIYLANMRLAPVQVTALGHGASSMSPFIDYYAVDEDFAGDPDTFSEKLILLPKDGMPHVRSGAAVKMEPILREKPGVVRIVIASTTMKLNPRLMEALVKIRAAVKTPVRFEFLTGLANGLVREQVRVFIQRYLPDAVIYPHQAYAQYMNCINDCDLFLNPFPYGNMNGVADMAIAGLVGVCRTGPQIHERIDGAMFRRLGLPEWLIAESDEDYAAAAVRLIDNHEERLALRRGVIARGGDRIFLEGRANALCESLAALSGSYGPGSDRALATP
jgi:predicted O-linked N-acetylglucosamine transferase (SPINDLY family)